ncbi:MAG: CBS domain-containing protein, partial [Gemmatimonadota bacterium]|nr:CBS domain-containing protein [Gemmatimonadota bacterium]
MNLEQQLLAQFATDHPAEVAAALAAMSHREAALVLGDLAPAIAAGLLHYLPSLSAALALEQLSVEEAAAVLIAVRPDIVAPILRTTPNERRAAVIACFPPRLQEAISSLLIYAEDTAGALMDPEVLTAFEQEPVRQVLERIQRNPEHALYYLYVVADNQRLVGVVNMRELMGARPEALLASVCTRNVASIAASATWQTVVGHPAWGSVHALPVVDRTGQFVGVLRYEIVRALERRQAGDTLADSGLQTASALGELFGLGLRGVFHWPTSG